MAEKNLASHQIKISKKYSTEERLAIAADVIEYIRERCAKGLGPGNKPYSGKANEYSKSYYNSLDFKNAKGRSKKITLNLSGDMLTEIETLPGTEEEGKVVIGFPTSSSQYGKAEGNIIGSYGKSSGRKSKARPFLKLTPEEVKKILKNFPLDDDKKREDAVKARAEAIKNSKGDVDFDDEMDE